MPVTRTASRQQYLQDETERDLGSPREPAARTSATKRKRDAAAKAKPVALGEVIEISSDDEPPPQTNAALADLRRQLRKLKEENIRCKEDLSKSQRELLSARAEIVELRGSSAPGKGKGVLDISQLEDSVNCEVCTLRMWFPYILPECGHTFCQSCLQDWFSSTLAQFMNTHPHYDLNDPAPYLRQFQAMMHNRHILHNPHTAAYFAQFQQQTPQPQYTCPTCREPVKNRPVEDFTLKAIVRTVADATGEESPRKQGNSGRGKATAPVSRKDDLWAGYFPRAT
ncbi:putative RING-type zinc-finger [Lyophyllum shimeji]|uniref:RING-type zinc-finger n=1 Tax=Lyophyllum shimeji TaxID=47721 RepID=A0A9P3PJX4_LYOSH|nr:putative RING-type zinc-finger [Lyophyllum shimeji]